MCHYGDAVAANRAMSVSEVVASNVRRMRKSWRHRWSQEELALRLAEQTGDDKWDGPMVSKVENHRRRVTLDELAALALVLQVSPVDLLMPPKGQWVKVGYAVMPGEVYFQGIVVFPGLWSKLHRFVMSGRLGGEATRERLIEAGFSPGEADLITSDEFVGWEFGDLSRGSDSEEGEDE